MDTDGHSAAKPQPKELEPQGTAKQENRKHRKTRKAKRKPGNELGRKTCTNKAKWPDSSTDSNHGRPDGIHDGDFFDRICRMDRM
jgi:hypothetical protein